MFLLHLSRALSAVHGLTGRNATASQRKGSKQCSANTPTARVINFIIHYIHGAGALGWPCIDPQPNPSTDPGVHAVGCGDWATAGTFTERFSSGSSRIQCEVKSCLKQRSRLDDFSWLDHFLLNRQDQYSESILQVMFSLTGTAGYWKCLRLNSAGGHHKLLQFLRQSFNASTTTQIVSKSFIYFFCSTLLVVKNKIASFSLWYSEPGQALVNSIHQMNGNRLEETHTNTVEPFGLASDIENLFLYLNKMIIPGSNWGKITWENKLLAFLNLLKKIRFF